MKQYEKELPAQYVEIAHVRFDAVKTGFLYDLKSVLPGIILTLLGWIIVKPAITQILISLGIFALSIYPYFSLHEIIHGLVMKAMTGENVKIGFEKSGGYCGMPDLYVYRKVAVQTAPPRSAWPASFVWRLPPCDLSMCTKWSGVSSSWRSCIPILM